MPVTRHIALILVPALLLAGIAVFGLVEYRHAITAEARGIAMRWTEQAEPLLAKLAAETDTLPSVIPYREIPAEADAATPDADRLERATIEKDAMGLRGLLESQDRTASGLPVRVLAAWRLFDLSGTRADAERLAELAIHEAPSAISAPVVRTLIERFPDAAGWDDEWQTSELRRAVLADHPQAEGFVATPEGPAFKRGDRVLTAPELRASTRKLLAEQRTFLPPWMALDLVALEQSLVSPVKKPFVSGGSPVQVVVGIANPDALYARYWRVVWWAAALIVCALATAVTGIVLVTRTLARERRLGELKSQFVASVSHELRAPVASMRLMADALDAGKVVGEKAGEFHRLMSQEGARLSSLIENVLDFARIEEGRKDYAFSETNLSALVADTIAVMKPVAAERGIEIETRSDARLTAQVDGTAIEQALVNLLDNAIKFSPPGSKVAVRLDAEGETGWRLAVEDEGPGIPAADRKRVFERFTRLGNELRRETKGTGIGLSIVKHIVGAHGGTVWIEGREGAGTKFIISCAS